MKDSMIDLAREICYLMTGIDGHFKRNKNLSKQDLKTIIDEYDISAIKINNLLVYYYKLVSFDDDTKFIYKGMLPVDPYEIWSVDEQAIYTDYIFCFETDTDIEFLNY